MNSGATDPMQNAYFAAFYMSLGDALGTVFVALCLVQIFGRRILLMALLFVVGVLTFSLGRLQNVGVFLLFYLLQKPCPKPQFCIHIYT